MGKKYLFHLQASRDGESLHSNREKALPELTFKKEVLNTSFKTIRVEPRVLALVPGHTLCPATGAIFM